MPPIMKRQSPTAAAAWSQRGGGALPLAVTKSKKIEEGTSLSATSLLELLHHTSSGPRGGETRKTGEALEMGEERREDSRGSQRDGRMTASHPGGLKRESTDK